MKRSKKMFTRFTSLLHNAVEALAPEMSLLEQFRYHWKCVTQFFLDNTDDRVSVENTTIPRHMEEMIKVLQQEEQENGTGSAGPSMEYMLQHKLLETMQALGKADCPPGMKRQVLSFFTNLLGKSRQQLLPHVNVHKPINRMIRCCGDVKAAPSESEEVQFLLQVSSKLKQDPHLVNFFLEAPGSSESGSSPSLSPGMEMEREKPEYYLVDVLLALLKSEDSRVAIKACEGLLLCTSIPEDKAAMTIVLYTTFCERMADQLAKLFKSLPAVVNPADINQLSATWGFDLEDQTHSFPGKRQMIAFISWLDYVNQLSVNAHPMVAKALAGAIRERFILTTIEPGLSQASEPCAITVTTVLTRCLKLVTSSALAQQFADILLGDDSNAEQEEYQSPHKIRRLLIQRINHLDDQVAIETLRLFQALLKLPYQPIIDTLITRNFRKRNYIDFDKMKRVEKERLARESENPNSFDTYVKTEDTAGLNVSSKSSDPPADENTDKPQENNISDRRLSQEQIGVDEQTSFKTDEEKSEYTAEKPEELYEIEKTGPFLESLNISEIDSNNMQLSPTETFSKKKIEKAVNGFLLILPDTMKTSQISGETGYDSYLRDAHKQCQTRSIQTFQYSWPVEEDMVAENATLESDFYEGAFLNTVFKRLQRQLDQPYEMNLEVTATISLICQFRHPNLHEFLMDTSGSSRDHILTLHRILLKICHDIKNRCSRIANFQEKLLAIRKSLVETPDQLENGSEETFMMGVIILEEFCKELAAIAFVTATMDQD